MQAAIIGSFASATRASSFTSSRLVSATRLFCGAADLPFHYRMCPKCRKFYLLGTVSLQQRLFGARRHHALCVGFVLAERKLSFGATLFVPARSVPDEPCVREC